MAQLMRGLNYEQREAERALYAKAVELRKQMPLKAVAKQLGLNLSRAYALLGYRPYSEEELVAIAERNARWAEENRQRAKRRQEWHRELRAEAAQERRDERHTTKANAVACLIEALIEMWPYLPETDA